MSTVNEKMTALADEIRELSGNTEKLSLDTMTSNVSNANDEIDAQIDLLTQIKNTINTLPEASEGINPVLQNKTVTPTTNSQTITADDGYDGLGAVTVTGDNNLIASNIKSGVSIFGINGTAESGGNGSIETCTVTFDNENLSNDCPIYALVATIFENGERKTYVYYLPFIVEGPYRFTISNIVCGTKIYLTARVYQVDEHGVYTEIDGSAIYESSLILDNYGNTVLTFTAPSVANENCTIYYAYNA